MSALFSPFGASVLGERRELSGATAFVHRRSHVDVETDVVVGWAISASRGKDN
jgi:hypothetical protein